MKSSILDSNIFIRHLVQDNKEQSPKATKIFASIEKGKMQGEVSLLVINEVLWILERYYDLSRKIFIPQFMEVLSLSGIKVLEVKKEKLMKVLDHMQQVKYDFTDIYLFSIAGSKEIFSFDKDFEKLASS